MASYQDRFIQYFESFKNDFKPIVENYARLKSFVQESESTAIKLQSDDQVVSSEYFFLAAFACLGHLAASRFDEDIYQKGKSCMSESTRLLPNDKEYKLYTLVYTIFQIETDKGYASFDRLKEIYKECPSFRLLDKNLISAEWSEDVFNMIFSRYLNPVVDSLMLKSTPEICEEACTLLASMPDMDAKLKAYTYLSRLLYDKGEYEESLRNARLGVELLGSSHSFDFRDETSNMWAECWTRVATCNRRKKEYDFAMSLYEKGASNGIVDCIHFLGEMYETGQSEDVDLSKAAALYAQADALQTERTRILQDEKEQRERELKAKAARELAEKERVERKAALDALLAKNRKKKIFSYSLIGLLSIYIIGVFVFLVNRNVKDKIYDYVKKDIAVITYNDSRDGGYIVCMDRHSVYLDNMKSLIPMLDVANPNPSKQVRLVADEGGVNAVIVEGQPLSIHSSQDLDVRRQGNSYDFLVSNAYNGTNYYLRLSSKGRSVINLIDPDVYPDHIIAKAYGDMTESYARLLGTYFSSSKLKRMKDEGISVFASKYRLSLDNLDVKVEADISFDKLMLSFSRKELGSMDMMDTFINDAWTLLDGGLTDNIIMKLFDVSYLLENRRSFDGKSTFVIKTHGDDSHDKLGLFIVDNETRTYKCLDHGMDIEFMEDRIRITKYGRFLLIFSANTYVYYDYYGEKI